MHLLSTMLSLFVVFAFPLVILGKRCETLDGTWYNQLGSEVILRHERDGKLTGEYRTAAERHVGAAGEKHSAVLGAAPYDYSGATFAFAVVWRNGSSTTVWTGQCIICEDGHEKLLTSWLLRSQVDTCIDKWKSTMIGRDVFTRHEQAPGPRKKDNTHSPLPSPGSSVTRRSVNYYKKIPCDLNDKWYNDVGSEMILEQANSGIVTGEYRTAVERKKGSAGHTHSKIYGIGSYHNPNSTFAFFVVWREGASVTGWVGQCHVCGENKSEVIESTWLLRSKIKGCHDNWQSTLYGENGFTTKEQKAGPRKDLGTNTPNRDGEDADAKVLCSSASLTNANVLLSGVAAIFCATCIFFFANDEHSS